MKTGQLSSLLAGLFFLAAASFRPAWAESAAAFYPTPQQQTQLDHIQTYLNGLTTLRARFIQQTGDTVLEGSFFLSRPGRMRIDYDPPVGNIIVADGASVHFWDAEVRQSSRAAIGSTLADLILRQNITLSGAVTVIGLHQSDAVIEVTLVQADDPGLGQLTLVLQEQPMALRQWRVLDAQGAVTQVTLADVVAGERLNDALFRFQPPSAE